MNQLDLFLQRHAMVHASDVGGAAFTTAGTFAGLSDAQMRERPGGLNSLAWLLWHVARVEDGCIAGTALGAAPLLDDAWVARLGVDERGDGEGMSREQVAALSDSIDIAALREYRDAVGRRTRELVAGLSPDLWDGTLSDAEIEDRVARGCIPADEAPHLRAFTRSGMLWWWGVEHTHYHIGQAAMIRGRVLRGEA